VDKPELQLAQAQSLTLKISCKKTSNLLARTRTCPIEPVRVLVEIGKVDRIRSGQSILHDEDAILPFSGEFSSFLRCRSELFYVTSKSLRSDAVSERTQKRRDRIDVERAAKRGRLLRLADMPA